MIYEIVTGSMEINRRFSIGFDANGYILVSGFCADVSLPVGPVINDDQWHSVIITYDGAGTISLYIDYAFITTASAFTDTCGGPLTSIVYDTAGNDNWLGTDLYGDKKYIGDLKNIKFYDYVLSSYTIINDLAQEKGSMD